MLSPAEDYAIFIYYDIPVVTKISSSLHGFLIGMEKEYIIGTLEKCEELAEDIIAVGKGV